MTSHEYAKLLLAGEDLPLVSYNGTSELSKDITSFPEKVYALPHDEGRNTQETIMEDEVIPFGYTFEEVIPVLEIQDHIM